jgi:hypothetical protein
MEDQQSFSDRVQQQLSTVKAALDRTQTQIQAANSKALDELRAERDRAAAAMQTRQQEAEAARGRMKTYFETKKAETDAKIDEWKAQREVQKLQDRANDAEAYFATTLDVATAAIDEAGAAALDAIEARRVADEATATR